VLALLKPASFRGLDGWKQLGFYAQPVNDKFQSPNVAVEKNVSEAVYLFAWRAVTTLDFLLKGANLERYITRARLLRSKMTEKEHTEIEKLGSALFEMLFSSEETEGARQENS
jgi:hypothetical protein